VATGASQIPSKSQLVKELRARAPSVLCAKIPVVWGRVCFSPKISALQTPSLEVDPRRQNYWEIKYGQPLALQTGVVS
jgi:hypothetical protein